MPLPDDLSLRTAGVDDMLAIVDLRLSVGWAAHEWALRLTRGTSVPRHESAIYGNTVGALG